jgi:Ni,Fe-hydrogenase maturation factor
MDGSSMTLSHEKNSFLQDTFVFSNDDATMTSNEHVIIIDVVRSGRLSIFFKLQLKQLHNKRARDKAIEY